MITKSLFTLLFIALIHELPAQNVGVGTSNPSEKLQVEGGIKVGYTSSANSQGTLRSTGTDLEYNNGFNWRSLVNYTSAVELSSLTPLQSIARNTWVQVPGVELTLSTPGIYLVIFKIGGYSNASYSLGGTYWDLSAIADFRSNGVSLLNRPRKFIVPEYSYQGVATNRIDYFESPVEYSTIQTISTSTTYTIFAQMSSDGTPPSQWVVDNAQIMAIRLN